MLNIAHRGASGRFPENTLRSFSAALAAGADMCELDVRATRDGHLVVLHDASVDRTTEGRGQLETMTLEQVKRLDAGIKFGGEFAGERIPALAEVFDLTIGHCGLNLELKAEGIERAVCELVCERAAVGSTLVSAFDWAAIGRVRDYAPEVRVALLASRRPAQLLTAAIEMKAAAIAPRADLVSAELCTAAHRHAIDVYAWTVDEPGAMRKLIGDGVDGITTNFPERLAEVTGR